MASVTLQSLMKRAPVATSGALHKRATRVERLTDSAQDSDGRAAAGGAGLW